MSHSLRLDDARAEYADVLAAYGPDSPWTHAAYLDMKRVER